MTFGVGGIKIILDFNMEVQMLVYTIAEVFEGDTIGMIYCQRSTKEAAIAALDAKRINCPRLNLDVWEYSIKRLFV